MHNLEWIHAAYIRDGYISYRTRTLFTSLLLLSRVLYTCLLSLVCHCSVLVVICTYVGLFVSIRRTRGQTPLANPNDMDFVLRFFFIVLTNIVSPSSARTYSEIYSPHVILYQQMCWAPVYVLRLLVLLKYPVPGKSESCSCWFFCQIEIDFWILLQMKFLFGWLCSLCRSTPPSIRFFTPSQRRNSGVYSPSCLRPRELGTPTTAAVSIRRPSS